MPNLVELAEIVPIQVFDGVVARRVQGDRVTPGLHRVAWDLRRDAPPAAQGGRGGQPAAAAGFGGRGGNAGPAVSPARFTATIGTLSGDTFTALAKPVSFAVVAVSR